MLKSMTGEAASALYDSVDNGSNDGSDSDGSIDHDAADDLSEIAEDLKTNTQCLLDLDSLIRDPAADPEPVAVTCSTLEAMKTDPWAPHEPYRDRIARRFPKAQEILVTRLAIANLNRFLRNQNARTTNLEEAEAGVVEAPAPTAAESSEGQTKFHDSGLGTSLGTPSSYAETVMSYRQGEERGVRIPSLPDEAKEGKPFECLVCGQLVSVRNNSAWK
jgi:hypothetical protein